MVNRSYRMEINGVFFDLLEYHCIWLEIAVISVESDVN